MPEIILNYWALYTHTHTGYKSKTLNLQNTEINWYYWISLFIIYYIVPWFSTLDKQHIYPYILNLDPSPSSRTEIKPVIELWVNIFRLIYFVWSFWRIFNYFFKNYYSFCFNINTSTTASTFDLTYTFCS